MSTYLDELNVKINSTQYNEWYINSFLYDFELNKNTDEFLLILNKYSDIFYSYKKIKVDIEDAKTILYCYKSDYNILIKACMDCLLSMSDLRSKSNLVKDCVDYINLYFDNNNSIKDGLPIHNLITILKWTIYKHPDEKQVIGNLLYSNTTDDKYDSIRSFSLAGNILGEEELRVFLSKEQYLTIFSKHYKVDVEPNEFYIYMGTYKTFLKYFEKGNKKEYKGLLKKYCDFILHNLNSMNNITKQIELQIVRQYMDLLDWNDDNDYLTIDNELDRANKEQLSKLECYSVELPEEQCILIKKQIKNSIVLFDSLSNDKKIKRMLVETSPLSLKSLKESYKESKKGFNGFFNENILDYDGRVINFGKLSEKQELSLKSMSSIALTVDLYFDIIFTPFYNSFKMDGASKIFIKDVISNNKLIDSSRIKLMEELFTSFFEGKYKESLFNIVLELEESLRYYFKHKGLNIVKKDGSCDLIGLNNIFNNYDKNSFRDELLKVIDEDYYFTLKWFLTDKYGFDIRDKISHRLQSTGLYKTKFAIYIAIHIFRLYWGFQTK